MLVIVPFAKKDLEKTHSIGILVPSYMYLNFWNVGMLSEVMTRISQGNKLCNIVYDYKEQASRATIRGTLGQQ